MSNLKFLGLDTDGSFIVAELKDDNTIKRFNGFDLIEHDHSYDSETYLNLHMWTHSVELIDGTKLKSGTKLTYEPELSQELLEIYDSAYQVEGSYCTECGIFHDTETIDYDPAYTIVDCDLFCKSCVDSTDLLTDVIEPDDLFKAKDITGMNKPELEEVDTLFCDSSGFGGAYEPALTKTQAKQACADLIKEHGPLKAGITDMGQFQLYITLYKVA